MTDWDISKPIPAELAGHYLGWLRAEIGFILDDFETAGGIGDAKRRRARTLEAIERLRSAEARGIASAQRANNRGEPR